MLWFPLHQACQRTDACSGPAARASADARRAGEWSPGLHGTGHSCLESQGYPRLPGRPLPACRGQTPRRVRRRLRPHRGDRAAAFKEPKPLGTRNHKLFGADTPRPTRSRTYASPNPLPGKTQGSLSACRAYALAEWDSHPQDDIPTFRKPSPTSFLSDRPCLAATGFVPEKPKFGLYPPEPEPAPVVSGFWFLVPGPHLCLAPSQTR